MNQKKKNFLHKPFYPGGNEAMDAFIKQHLQYPEEALEARKEGTVKVGLTMDHKGKILDAEAINPAGFGMDEEAVRVVKLLQFKVAKNHKVKVTFHKELNIHFHLPPQKPEQPALPEQVQNTGISYTYLPAKTTAAPPKKSYNYQIFQGK